MDKERLARQMNRSVITYDEHAVVHKKMAHRILCTLKEKVLQAENILEIGCGTGYLTQLLIDHYPQASVTAVDLAEKMSEMAGEKVEPSSRVRFLVGDAELIDLGKQDSFDLIVSNATLHWLQNPEGTLTRWVQRLKKGGWFIATTYGPDTFQELRLIFERVELELGMTPQQHTMLLRSAGHWERLLQETGLSRVYSVEFWNRSIYDDCRQFLQSVKAMGDSYSEADQSFSTARLVLLEVIKRYNWAYRSGEGVYSTYHLLQIAGQKGWSSIPSFCI
ncbi:methyltransferase domain-containing protein [Paenactinomyces guangxiensis]|uniref:Malonyl-[acyl-carrier protein] O-methyltransferase n=1 Tax=Paenactinomyces guangxiensis TaxID=1490290 RepID=A0A7W1WPT7_9BACL|nr:methyltransferase domain-containing protein [Paenactinomyces guangxiensis]MBA4493851.1 methyltransferase domain-containing protein [Paenactinomyces guangxiensis]MBH8591317.1 methyltransferase domain-containing protein [Paenactinomyces guangxiensis]